MYHGSFFPFIHDGHTAGVELSAVIAERLRAKGLGGAVRVSVVTPGQSILEGSPEGQRQAAVEVLTGLGVDIVTGGCWQVEIFTARVFPRA